MISILGIVFSTVSLVTVIVAAAFIARQKMSYFTTIRSYLVIGCLAFAALIAFSIYSHMNPATVAMRLGATSCIVAAISLGLAVANLTDYPKATCFKELLVAFTRKPKLSIIAYTSVMVIGLASTWIPQLYPSLPQFYTVLQYDVFSGVMITSKSYEPWYAIVMLTVLISFLLYPVSKLVLLSEKVKTEKVKLSIQTFGISLGTIGFLVFLFNVVSAFTGYHLIEVGYLLDSFFFYLMVYSFKSCTILSGFIEDIAVPHLPFHTNVNVFSKTLGLDHRQMTGRKILLEFDPASPYEKVIQNFAAEALAHGEPVVVFTRRGSAIYSSLGEQEAVKFFCLTQQVSVPKKFSMNKVLLPSSDISLMLNALGKTLNMHLEGNINIVFDSLSDLVLSIGFEKTYHFMRYAFEVLASPRITALFLLNRAAHDPKIASTLNGLFSNRISFGKRGIETVKLSEVKADTVDVEKRSFVSLQKG